MSEFERIINDTMQAFADYNNFDHNNGMELEEIDDVQVNLENVT